LTALRPDVNFLHVFDRRATVDDAPTLSALAARTFTETFGHLYPPQDLQAFLEEAYTVERQRVILAHPDYAVWLLELDGEAVGHAAAGPVACRIRM
jgi:hypothetical protein